MSIVIDTTTGAVTKDGEPLGTITGNVCKLTDSVAGPVKGAIRKAAGNPDLRFAGPGDVESLSNEELLAMMEARGLMPTPPAEVARQAPVNNFAEVNAGVYQDPLARIRALAVAGKIPPQPKAHPAMGDKDPAVVAWARAHATPEEFAAKYQGKRVPMTAADYERAERERLTRKLPGEKADKGKEKDNDDD